MLSPEAIARIDSICSQLDHSQANAQIAVVTIHNLDGDDSADFATRLFEKMKIGAKGTDRGILLLFAIDDRRRSIKVGYGLEGILPDGKTGDIGRSIVPLLQAKDYDAAVMSEVGQIAGVIAADAKVTLQDEPGMVRRRSGPPGSLAGQGRAADYSSHFLRRLLPLALSADPRPLRWLGRSRALDRWGRLRRWVALEAAATRAVAVSVALAVAAPAAAVRMEAGRRSNFVERGFLKVEAGGESTVCVVDS